MEKGAFKAVENINTIISDVLCGMDSSNIYAIDQAMIDADGTKDKSRLGSECDPGSFYRVREQQPMPWSPIISFSLAA